MTESSDGRWGRDVRVVVWPCERGYGAGAMAVKAVDGVPVVGACGLS
jgi:hypothetical protein